MTPPRRPDYVPEAERGRATRAGVPALCAAGLRSGHRACSTNQAPGRGGGGVSVGPAGSPSSQPGWGRGGRGGFAGGAGRGGPGGVVSVGPAGSPRLAAGLGAGRDGRPRGRSGEGRRRGRVSPESRPALATLSRAPAAAQPQFTLRSHAASMTDTLLPAAPQPLEKEGDSYFRKVGGFGQAGNLRAADLFSPRLRRSLQERATRVDQAGRGRGRAGLRAGGADARGEGCGGRVRDGRELVASGAGDA